MTGDAASAQPCPGPAGAEPRESERIRAGANPTGAEPRYVARTRSSYDAVAQDYADRFADELADKPLDRALLAALVEQAPPGVVADLGCGPGQVAGHLAGLGRPVVALDLSPAMGVAARRLRPGLPFAAGSLLRLPLADRSLAALVCLYAVIHLEPADLSVAFGQLSRVLVPGGRALVSVHLGEEVRHLSEWWAHPVDLDFRFISASTLQAAADGAGLSVTASIERAPYEGEVATRRGYLLARR